MSQENNSVNPEFRTKSSDLKLRLISAAVGLPLLGLTLYFGFWTVSIVAIGVAAMVALEAHDMAYRSERFKVSRVFAFTSGAVIVGSVVFVTALAKLEINENMIDPTAIAVGFIVMLLIAEIAMIVRFRDVAAVKRNIVLAYGAVAVLAVAMLPLIVSMENGRELLTYGVLVVFAADTGAYLLGRSIGNRKMAPSVSPGKTWEGLIGGIVSALLASWALAYLLSLDYSPGKIVGIGLGIAVLGVGGDLFESWVKRLAGVKDSGSLIPGHGGLLDRLDALAPNFVFIYFIERWFG